MRWRFAAALCVLIVYVAMLYQMPKRVFLSPDEGAKFLMLHSMEWTWTGLTYHIAYGGQQMDLEDRFYPKLGNDTDTFPYPRPASDGAVLFHWPIWFPLVSKVPYNRLGLTGIFLVPLVSGWLIAILSGWLTERLRPGLGALTIVLVGLGTPVFFYSVSFWEHTAATLLGLVAVTLCVLRPRPLSYLAAGVLVLAATLLRIEMIVLGGALVLVSAGNVWLADSPRPVRRRNGGARGITAALIVLIVALAVLSYSYLPLRLHTFIEWIPRRIGRLPELLPSLLPGLGCLLISTPTNQGPSAEPLWIHAALVAVGGCLIAPFLRRTRLEATLLVFGLSTMLAFSVLLLVSNEEYRSLHGLFPLAPFAVLAPYGLAIGWRSAEPKLFRLSLIALSYGVLGNGALLLSFVSPSGLLTTGLEWGPRYLLTLYPLLAILALVAAADYWRSNRPRLLRRTVLVLMSAAMMAGVHLEVRGLAMLRANLRVFLDWDQALRADGPVVTDIWWLPTALADLFVTHEVYFIDRRARLTEWVSVAAAHGVHRFVFAGLGAVDPVQFGDAAAYQHGPLRRLREMTVVAFEIPSQSITPSRGAVGLR